MSDLGYVIFRAWCPECGHIQGQVPPGKAEQMRALRHCPICGSERFSGVEQVGRSLRPQEWVSVEPRRWGRNYGHQRPGHLHRLNNKQRKARERGA